MDSITIQGVEKVFTFTDKHDNKKWCKVIVRIEEKHYDGKTYYHITFNSRFSDDTENSSHPFLLPNLQDLSDFMDGTIIVKNKLTSVMIEFLLMDDTELSKHSGNTSPIDYRTNILRNIVTFWD